MNRTEFLTYLKGLPATGKALSGQHLDESDPQGSYDALVKPLPDVPAILGGSPRVGQNDDQRPNETLLSILGDHATHGGVVTLECHFANPWLPDQQQSIGSAWLPGSKPDLRILSAQYGVTPAYLAFWAQVDRWIDQIKTLPDNTLLILRLFHEANGEHFWWGYDPAIPDQDQRQIALYLRVKNYVTAKIKQYPLWVHSGTAASWYAPVSYGRPDWVDLVGCSLYSNDLSFIHPQDLTDLQNDGRPVLFMETGPDDSKPQPGNWDCNQLVTKRPSNVVGWQTWQGFTTSQNGYLHLAAVENQNWKSLYQSPHTITRSALPTTTVDPHPLPTPPVAAPSPNPVPAPPLPSPSFLTGVPNPFPNLYSPLT